MGRPLSIGYGVTQMAEMNTFDPVQCSDADCAFLLAHLGTPTIVALRHLQPPATRATVVSVLERVNELQALEQADGAAWCGVDAIKQAIRVWTDQNQKWKHDHQHKRNAPRWPSMYSYDAKGRPHRGGPGSDNDRVRTYFGPAGERIPFAIDLIPDYTAQWVGPGMTEAPADKGLHVDTAANRIECRVRTRDGVCGHTETYKSESRTSYNAARTRMSKHLRKATENADGHREVHLNEFGATDAQ